MRVWTECLQRHNRLDELVVPSRSFPPFQAFTLKANGKADRIITDIEVTLGFDPSKPPDPLPTRTATKALWDTGASRSVITTELSTSLGLIPVGTREVHHGDGVSVRNEFIVNLFLPNHVCMVGVLATEFPASHERFSVLVGMDVICVGDFSITNLNGRTWMSFRTPSCVAIDYVVEANNLKYAGVKANAPCPCGSGKKYKKCHRP